LAACTYLLTSFVVLLCPLVVHAGVPAALMVMIHVFVLCMNILMDQASCVFVLLVPAGVPAALMLQPLTSSASTSLT
jgi:hypothetical protein